MLTQSLESAQEKIEGFNFDARKHVLEFDDVLNFQRKIFYGRRREILLGSDEAVRAYIAEISLNGDETERNQVEQKMAQAAPEHIAALRGVILQAMDMFWVEHLETMDYMRASVNLRAYGQRDPLVEYKREGLRMFKDMELAIALEILKLISQIDFAGMSAQAQVPVAPKLVETREGAEGLTAEVPAVSSSSAPTTSDGSKIGRNDPCPCGSGKKYKACGLIDTEEHRKRMENK